MKDTEEALLVGAFISFVFVNVVWIILVFVNKQPDELVCRDGKLFSITHENNITIYESEWKECEQ